MPEAWHDRCGNETSARRYIQPDAESSHFSTQLGGVFGAVAPVSTLGVCAGRQRSLYSGGGPTRPSVERAIIGAQAIDLGVAAPDLGGSGSGCAGVRAEQPQAVRVPVFVLGRRR